jgi:hypothetical protein
MKRFLKVSAGLLFSTVTAFATAQAILPDASGFGALSGANFGSPTSSIPNDAVAQESNLANTVTLGLSATQRYSSPTVTSNGAGTFFAGAGAFVSEPGYSANPLDPFAKWNFNYAIVGSATAISQYNYRLYYDFNPAVGNGIATHEHIPLIGSQLNTALGLPSQGSQNLGFDFLALNPLPPASSVLSFDPNALGEYTFKLAAYTPTGILGLGFSQNEVFSTSMVVSVVPEPGEWAMMLAGLGVVSAIARRRRNK